MDARNSDIRPVSVSTRRPSAIEHMFMWRCANRSLCHSLIM